MYADKTDLMVGDITYAVEDKERFLTVAETEINVALGFLYVVPLSPALATDSHIALLLKRTEALIASGRIIMDKAAAGEDNSLQAYGLSLLKEGQGILMQILNGQIDLIGFEKIATAAAEGNGPSIVQGDEFSGVDAYYHWLNENPLTPRFITAPIWQPGFRGGS